MFTTWLRENKYASWVLAVLRVYLGWKWMTAGWEKITSSPPFSAEKFLQNAVAHPVLGPDKQMVYPTYHAFLKNFALPNVGLFNVIVPWGEFLVGLGLILGVLTTAAVFFGMTMNFAYMMAGTVSSNPWLILISIFIIVAGYNAGRIGGDYWVIPWLRKYEKKLLHLEVEIPEVGMGRKTTH
jgi:thiosulfate dehydrogenase [quinone] large subunit